jgi:hypothetical protein
MKKIWDYFIWRAAKAKKKSAKSVRYQVESAHLF